jgi:chromosome segregation ATPase
MLSGEVRARLQAVKDIGHGVDAYGRAVARTVAGAQSDLTAAAAEFQVALATTQRRLSDATRRCEAAAADLAACQEGCGPLQQALAQARFAEDRARDEHDHNRQACAQLEELTTRLRMSLRQSATEIEQKVPPARRQIASYGQAIADALRREMVV